VVSWNVGRNFTHNAHDILGLALALSATIVALQETGCSRRNLPAQTKDFHGWYSDSDPKGHHGVGLLLHTSLAKHVIKTDRHGSRGLSLLLALPRKHLRITTLHWPHTEEEARETRHWCTNLQESDDDQGFENIWLGDFNAILNPTLDYRAVTTHRHSTSLGPGLLADLTRWNAVDTFRLLHPSTMAFSRPHFVHGEHVSSSRIDAIWVSFGLAPRVRAAGVVDLHDHPTDAINGLVDLSDHLPVTASLDLQIPAPPVTSRLVHRRRFAPSKATAKQQEAFAAAISVVVTVVVDVLLVQVKRTCLG